MTFDDLYTRGVLPVRFVVCGLPMHDMTVGHARILTALELWCPRTSKEILLAAFVCSIRSETFSRWWSSKWFMRAVRFWIWRLGPDWDYAKSREAWNDYVEYHRDEPAASFDSGNAAKTPWLDAMKATLCARMGYNPERFDSVRLSDATRDYAAIAESSGFATLAKMSVSQSQELKEHFNQRR